VKKLTKDELKDIVAKLQKIYHLIKEQKIDFKYGTSNNYMEIPILARVNYKNEFIHYSKEIYAFNIIRKVNIMSHTPIGYAYIDNIDIIQEISVSNEGNIMIEYSILLNEMLNFKHNKKLTFDLIKIYNLIYKWQGGDEEYRVKFLEMIREIGVPNKYKKVKTPAYRGLKLSDIALEKLKNNQPVKLDNKIFSSWSEDKDYAKDFTIKYINSRQQIYKGAIMVYSPKINEILINMYEFIKDLFPIDLKNTEKEFILINSPKTLILYPHRVEIV